MSGKEREAALDFRNQQHIPPRKTLTDSVLTGHFHQEMGLNSTSSEKVSYIVLQPSACILVHALFASPLLLSCVHCMLPDEFNLTHG